MIFDLYGTLVKFGIMHHPFRTLLKWAREQGRPANVNDARLLMTVDADVVSLAQHMGIKAPHTLMMELQSQIEEELASLSLYEDVISTLHALQSLGIPMVICSNLAQPYGAIIDRLLPQFNFQRFLSYEVGFIKPEPEMYRAVVRKFNVNSNECFFIGDTFIADYEGPINSGLQARHLRRDHQSQGDVLNNLEEIILLFK